MRFYIGSGLQHYELVRYYANALKDYGWEQTYDWTRHIQTETTLEALAEYAEAERKAIWDSDVVVILLPAGRGTHVELGLALAHDKKVFLCAASQEEFSIEHTVAFYELPGVAQLVGPADEQIKEIIKAQMK